MNWYRDFFQGVVFDFWAEACTPELTRSEADCVEKLLRVRPGDRLLDVPCGLGRHSLELASRGFDLTAVDFAREAIQALKKSAGGRIDTVQSDMRHLPWLSTFDGAFCLGNSFAYFDYEASCQFLDAISNALKPGAGFILQTGTAAESVLPSLDEKTWLETNNFCLLVENEYRATESRLDCRYTFIGKGRRETRPAHYYIFTVSELDRMLRQANLIPEGLFATTQLDPYEVGATQLILLARKPL